MTHPVEAGTCMAIWQGGQSHSSTSESDQYLDIHLIFTQHLQSYVYGTYRVAQKTGPPYLIANIPKIPWLNCVEIGELQYYMLNTVINFLFKNFIALWRHLAKTQLLCDAQIYLYNVNKRQ